MTVPANDDEPTGGETQARKRRRRNIGALPRHLPRVERIIEPDRQDCPCCKGVLHRIDEDATEAFGWVPATVRVIRTIRPKYACRHCQTGIVQAPAPRRLVEGSMTTTSTIAWIATARFAWSIPLNRQMQMLAGQGIVVDRSVPVVWMQKAAWCLEGLYELQLRMIHSQPRIFYDETRMPVLTKGRQRARIAQFWSHAMDDSPWNGPAPPGVCYIFANGRGYREIKEQVNTNTVERTMRSVAQGRRSSLFAGSEAGARTWAILSSLLQTARLNGLDPYTWLNDVLERIVSGAVKNHELEQLLAWNWRPAEPHSMRLAA